MSGRYAELYRRARQALEADAEARLERPLTLHERNLFRNCGTLTMLDKLGMTIYSAHDAEELAQKLATTSMQGRFRLALTELTMRLEQTLSRSITATEQEALGKLANIEEFWDFEQQIHTTNSADREATFQLLLRQVRSRQ
ncbi:MAG: hypothetical protein HC837_04540 [Chloroflexaceae bacterium]|nr:hypothetical protein [Chloroflexaceae bacterium]